MTFRGARRIALHFRFFLSGNRVSISLPRALPAPAEVLPFSWLFPVRRCAGSGSGARNRWRHTPQLPINTKPEPKHDERVDSTPFIKIKIIIITINRASHKLVAYLQRTMEGDFSFISISFSLIKRNCSLIKFHNNSEYYYNRFI